MKNLRCDDLMTARRGGAALCRASGTLRRRWRRDGGPDRAPPAAGERAGGRGEGAVPRGRPGRPSGERAGIRSFVSRIGIRRLKAEGRPPAPHDRREGAVGSPLRVPGRRSRVPVPADVRRPGRGHHRQTCENILVGVARLTVPPIPEVGAGRSPRCRALDSCIPLEEAALMPRPLLLSSPDAHCAPRAGGLRSD